MGTPVYMSPEQVQDSKRADHRSDIYSLGVTLHHLLSGAPPYDAGTDSNFAIFLKIVNEPLPRLPGNVPAHLQATIDKATAKDPADRFQDCGAFARALAAPQPAAGDATLLDDGPVPRPKPEALPPRPPALAAPEARPARRPLPPGARWAAIGLGAALLVALLVWASRPTEEDHWREALARGSAEGYEEFLQQHPDGDKAAEARVSLDWANRAFQRRNPGQRQDDAQAALAALLAALAYDSLAPTADLSSLRLFLASAQARGMNRADRDRARQQLERLAADSARVAGDAQLRADDDAYAEAKRQDSKPSYEGYIRDYPQGRHLAEARQAMERLATKADDDAYAAAKRQDSKASYEGYLREHPQGRHLAEARQAIERLATKADDDAYAAAKRQDSKASYEGYIRDYPRGLHLAEARQAIERLATDDDAYAAAKRQDSKAFYEGYIRNYPRGLHLAEARQAIERLEQAPQVPQAVRDLQASMVSISGGSFTMDELPAHQVTVSGFQMGKYEVTQAQWQAVMGSNPSGFQGCPSCPVESVSWDDVQAFIRKLNTLTGQTYRLPTEAEWEYAAGGGSSGRTKFAGTDSEGSLGGYAWYSANSGSKTHPVGQKSPNRLGLYDMSGNVLEWCSDWYGPYPSGAQTNPRGANSGSGRVNRGGSWHGGASYCRVALRFYYSPGGRSYYLGFRLARTP